MIILSFRLFGLLRTYFHMRPLNPCRKSDFWRLGQYLSVIPGDLFKQVNMHSAHHWHYRLASVSGHAKALYIQRARIHPGLLHCRQTKFRRAQVHPWAGQWGNLVSVWRQSLETKSASCSIDEMPILLRYL